jgi:hypothetical protein
VTILGGWQIVRGRKCRLRACGRLNHWDGSRPGRLDRGSDENEVSLTGPPTAAWPGGMAQVTTAGILRGCSSATAEMAELASNTKSQAWARFPGNLFEGAAVPPGCRAFPPRPAVVEYA